MGLSHWSEGSTDSLSGTVHPIFLLLILAYGQFNSSTKQISNCIRRPTRVCRTIDSLIRESVNISSKRNEPPSESDPHISSNDIEPPSDPDVNSWGPRSAVSGRRRWTPTRTANPTTGSTQSSQDEGLETLRESPSVYHSGNEAEDNDASSSTEGSDIESRPRFRRPLGGPESKTLKATKTFPSLPEELDDQLLLFTLSTKLCMAGKDAGTEGNRPVIRQLISQPYRVIINGYFCTLEVNLLK
jgi:hypothetical protein